MGREAHYAFSSNIAESLAKRGVFPLSTRTKTLLFMLAATWTKSPLRHRFQLKAWQRYPPVMKWLFLWLNLLADQVSDVSDISRRYSASAYSHRSPWWIEDVFRFDLAETARELVVLRASTVLETYGPLRAIRAAGKRL
jgi:hypothetical protein